MLVKWRIASRNWLRVTPNEEFLIVQQRAISQETRARRSILVDF